MNATNLNTSIINVSNASNATASNTNASNTNASNTNASNTNVSNTNASNTNASNVYIEDNTLKILVICGSMMVLCIIMISIIYCLRKHKKLRPPKYFTFSKLRIHPEIETTCVIELSHPTNHEKYKVNESEEKKMEPPMETPIGNNINDDDIPKALSRYSYMFRRKSFGYS